MTARMSFARAILLLLMLRIIIARLLLVVIKSLRVGRQDRLHSYPNTVISNLGFPRLILLIIIMIRTRIQVSNSIGE